MLANLDLLAKHGRWLIWRINFFFFLVTPAVWAQDQTQATTVTQAAAVTMPEP